MAVFQSHPKRRRIRVLQKHEQYIEEYGASGDSAYDEDDGVFGVSEGPKIRSMAQDGVKDPYTTAPSNLHRSDLRHQLNRGSTNIPQPDRRNIVQRPVEVEEDSEPEELTSSRGSSNREYSQEDGIERPLVITVHNDTLADTTVDARLEGEDFAPVGLERAISYDSEFSKNDETVSSNQSFDRVSPISQKDHVNESQVEYAPTFIRRVDGDFEDSEHSKVVPKEPLPSSRKGRKRPKQKEARKKDSHKSKRKKKAKKIKREIKDTEPDEVVDDVVEEESSPKLDTVVTMDIASSERIVYNENHLDMKADVLIENEAGEQEVTSSIPEPGEDCSMSGASPTQVGTVEVSPKDQPVVSKTLKSEREELSSNKMKKKDKIELSDERKPILKSREASIEKLPGDIKVAANGEVDEDSNNNNTSLVVLVPSGKEKSSCKEDKEKGMKLDERKVAFKNRVKEKKSPEADKKVIEKSETDKPAVKKSRTGTNISGTSKDKDKTQNNKKDVTQEGGERKREKVDSEHTAKRSGSVNEKERVPKQPKLEEKPSTDADEIPTSKTTEATHVSKNSARDQSSKKPAALQPLKSSDKSRSSKVATPDKPSKQRTANQSVKTRDTVKSSQTSDKIQSSKSAAAVKETPAAVTAPTARVAGTRVGTTPTTKASRKTEKVQPSKEISSSGSSKMPRSSQSSKVSQSPKTTETASRAPETSKTRDKTDSTPTMETASRAPETSKTRDKTDSTPTMETASRAPETSKTRNKTDSTPTKLGSSTDKTSAKLKMSKVVVTETTNSKMVEKKSQIPAHSDKKTLLLVETVDKTENRTSVELLSPDSIIQASEKEIEALKMEIKTLNQELEMIHRETSTSGKTLRGKGTASKDVASNAKNDTSIPTKVKAVTEVNSVKETVKDAKDVGKVAKESPKTDTKVVRKGNIEGGTGKSKSNSAIVKEGKVLVTENGKKTVEVSAAKKIDLPSEKGKLKVQTEKVSESPVVKSDNKKAGQGTSEVKKTSTVGQKMKKVDSATVKKKEDAGNVKEVNKSKAEEGTQEKRLGKAELKDGNVTSKNKTISSNESLPVKGTETSVSNSSKLLSDSEAVEEDSKTKEPKRSKSRTKSSSSSSESEASSSDSEADSGSRSRSEGTSDSSSSSTSSSSRSAPTKKSKTVVRGRHRSSSRSSSTTESSSSESSSSSNSSSDWNKRRRRPRKEVVKEKNETDQHSESDSSHSKKSNRKAGRTETKSSASSAKTRPKESYVPSKSTSYRENRYAKDRETYREEGRRNESSRHRRSRERESCRRQDHGSRDRRRRSVDSPTKERGRRSVDSPTKESRRRSVDSPKKERRRRSADSPTKERQSKSGWRSPKRDFWTSVFRENRKEERRKGNDDRSYAKGWRDHGRREFFSNGPAKGRRDRTQERGYWERYNEQPPHSERKKHEDSGRREEPKARPRSRESIQRNTRKKSPPPKNDERDRHGNDDRKVSSGLTTTDRRTSRPPPSTDGTLRSRNAQERIDNDKGKPSSQKKNDSEGMKVEGNGSVDGAKTKPSTDSVKRARHSDWPELNDGCPEASEIDALLDFELQKHTNLEKSRTNQNESAGVGSQRKTHGTSTDSTAANTFWSDTSKNQKIKEEAAGDPSYRRSKTKESGSKVKSLNTGSKRSKDETTGVISSHLEKRTGSSSKETDNVNKEHMNRKVRKLDISSRILSDHSNAEVMLKPTSESVHDRLSPIRFDDTSFSASPVSKDLDHRSVSLRTIELYDKSSLDLDHHEVTGHNEESGSLFRRVVRRSPNGRETQRMRKRSPPRSSRSKKGIRSANRNVDGKDSAPGDPEEADDGLLEHEKKEESKLDARIRRIREQNALILRRHQEIHEDIYMHGSAL